MFDSAVLKRRMRWTILTFFLVWIPGTIWLGVDHGSRLRFGGDDLQHAGPIVEGLLNMGFFMGAPALFAALLVFVVHAWRTERSD